MNKEIKKRHIEEIIEDDDSYTVKFLKAESYEDETVEITEDETEEMTIENSEVVDETKTDTKQEKNIEHRAAFPLEFERDEVDSRTISMAVSSESPVLRDFGWEVLSHRAGDVNLDRLNNKAPLLMDHNSRDQIGVIEGTRLDESQGRLYATVRFGKSARANEVFEDVLDNIRSQISIGYSIDNLEREVDIDSDEETYRAKFTPLEVSVVSMAADQSVGLGRSLSLQQQKPIIKEIKMEKVIEAEVVAEGVRETNLDAQIKVATTEAVAKREKDISEIYALASRHEKKHLADEAVAKGVSLNSFRGALLQEIENKPLETAEVGLTQKETREFSIVKAAKAQAGLIPMEEAAFEFEASRAHGKKIGRETKGFFVPEDVTNKWSSTQERVLSTAVGSAAPVVYTDLRYQDMIDALTPFSTVLASNPIVLANNLGNISIPRTTANSTSNWVGEGVNVAASDPAFDSVLLAEHTNGCFVDMTRTLLQNTNGFSVEAMVRRQLLQAMGTAWDQAAIAGNPAAVAASPRGIEFTAGVNATGFLAGGAPTYAELIAMESAVYNSNVDLGTNAVWITTPAQYGLTKSLATNGAGSPVASIDGRLDGRSVLISSQVTANTWVLGDFSSEFLVATWGGLEVISDSSALALQGGLRVIALSSVDFAVKHPLAFCVSV